MAHLDILPFNSIVVRLKVARVAAIKEAIVPFNSIVVRLKVDGVSGTIL